MDKQKETKAFSENQEYIKNLFRIEALKTKEASIKMVGDSSIQPILLTAYTLQYILIASSEIAVAKTENHKKSMKLLATYIQGLFVSTDLVLEGNYIKASATLKQDYEIMVAMIAVPKGQYKYGVNPGAKYAPDKMKPFYGHLNDIAHIAKDDILHMLLIYTDNRNISGISPVNQLNEESLRKLLSYDSLIKLQILQQALLLHLEIVGEDGVFKQSFDHYNMVLSIYTSNGLMS